MPLDDVNHAFELHGAQDGIRSVLTFFSCMIVERSMDPGWLSNSYVVGDRPGGHAVLIDAGGPPGPLERRSSATA